MHWHTNQHNSYYVVILFKIDLCETWWRLDHHPPLHERMRTYATTPKRLRCGDREGGGRGLPLTLVADWHALLGAYPELRLRATQLVVELVRVDDLHREHFGSHLVARAGTDTTRLRSAELLVFSRDGRLVATDREFISVYINTQTILHERC